MEQMVSYVFFIRIRSRSMFDPPSAAENGIIRAHLLLGGGVPRMGWGGSLIVQSPQNPTESRGAATK